MIRNITEKLIVDIGSQRVYIYGAGVYGRTLFIFFQENNICSVKGFIVSEISDEQKIPNDQIMSIKEYAAICKEQSECHRNDLIIIAVSEKYEQEITETLSANGITNYMILSHNEWDFIENEVRYDNIIPENNIAILMYHRVIENNYNFWKLNISPKIFEDHIRFISENYNVLRLEDDWSQLVNSNEKYVVITFDDGYVDNYKYAFPILEKYKVPATIFVSTDLIGTNDMYWWDELEKIFIIDEFEGNFIFEQREYKILNNDDREKACMEIRNYLKDLVPDDRNERLEDLREILGINKANTEELRCVRSEELKRMAESDYITIGCHTKSHLSMGKNKSKELLESEVRDSKKILEEHIGKGITTFAYPFGGDSDRCKLAEDIIMENGIEKTVIVKDGNINSDSKLCNLPRHMMFECDNIEKKLKKVWGIYG